jgi:hypothetical protein
MKAMVMTLVLASAVGCVASQAVAEDIGKKVCMADARRLCPAQVKALDRVGAEHCLFLKIDQTTPNCHDTILVIVKQRAQNADHAAPKSITDPSSSAGAVAQAAKIGSGSQ